MRFCQPGIFIIPVGKFSLIPVIQAAELHLRDDRVCGLFEFRECLAGDYEARGKPSVIYGGDVPVPFCYGFQVVRMVIVPE